MCEAVQSNVSYFFSETATTIIMKFTYTMDMSFTKLSLFFHKLLFIMSTLFPLLPVMLYTGHVNLLAEASELFIHTVSELIIIHKTVS